MPIMTVLSKRWRMPVYEIKAQMAALRVRGHIVVEDYGRERVVRLVHEDLATAAPEETPRSEGPTEWERQCALAEPTKHNPMFVEIGSMPGSIKNNSLGQSITRLKYSRSFPSQLKAK